MRQTLRKESRKNENSIKQFNAQWRGGLPEHMGTEKTDLEIKYKDDVESLEIK